jgi:hypothetical protein
MLDSAAKQLETPTDHPALATTNNKTNLCSVDGIGRSNQFSESMDGVKNFYLIPSFSTILINNPVETDS